MLWTYHFSLENLVFILKRNVVPYKSQSQTKLKKKKKSYFHKIKNNKKIGAFVMKNQGAQLTKFILK